MYCDSVDGHRHQGLCRQHWHSSNRHLSPVPEHSGNGKGLLISVPDWLRNLHYFSFRFRTDRMATVRHLQKLCSEDERRTPLILLVVISITQCTSIESKLRNVEKKFVWHRHLGRYSAASVRHRHSGIRASPILLVTASGSVHNVIYFCRICSPISVLFSYIVQSHRLNFVTITECLVK